MKTLIYLSLLISIFLLSACKKANPFSQYEGSWSGQYSGDDFGNWNATIDNDGVVTGSAVSDSFPTISFSLTGNITASGDFNAKADLFIQSIDFEGQISNSAVSGTWKNEDGHQGDWSGIKD